MARKSEFGDVEEGTPWVADIQRKRLSKMIDSGLDRDTIRAVEDIITTSELRKFAAKAWDNEESVTYDEDREMPVPECIIKRGKVQYVAFPLPVLALCDACRHYGRSELKEDAETVTLLESCGKLGKQFVQQIPKSWYYGIVRI